MATATVRLRGPNGELETRAALGTGPVDAACKAIDKVVGLPNTLVEYNVQSVTEGIDALGEVTVRVLGDPPSSSLHPQHGGDAPRTYLGHGAHTDIVVASAKAYLAVLNKLLVAAGYFDAVAEVSVPPAREAQR